MSLFKKFYTVAMVVTEIVKRRKWPNNHQHHKDDKTISIVVVNYNTYKDITRLLFSIYRIMGIDNLNAVVVIDNNSDDGSKELLQYLADHNLIHLIKNSKQKYHGPAINQGINYLAKLNKKSKLVTKYILILDSDVILLRNDLLKKSTYLLDSTGAAIAGELDYHGKGVGIPHVSSLLVDPKQVWKIPILPFINHGQPSKFFFKSIFSRGLKIVDFKFNEEKFLLHLGEGTLKAIYLQSKSDNQYFEWSKNYHSHHFSNTSNGYTILDAVDQLLFSETESLLKEDIKNTLIKQELLNEKLKTLF